MNMYYFYKWKSKPMNIINLKYQSGNPELRLGEAGGPEAHHLHENNSVNWCLSVSPQRKS